MAWTDFKVKEIWGRKFKIVKNGLDEADAFSFIDSVRDSPWLCSWVWTPLLTMGGHFLAHHPQEVVGTGVAKELELFAQVFDQLFVAAVRAQIVSEAAVALVEFQYAASVADYGLYLAVVSDDAPVPCQLVQVRLGEIRYGCGVKPPKRLSCSGPL